MEPSPATSFVIACILLLAGSVQFGLVFFNHIPDLDPNHYVRNLRLISGGLFVVSSGLFFRRAKQKQP